MIFNELYSAYYTAVAHILRRAVEGDLTEAEMKEIVREYAFSESALTILPALKTERWPLLCPDLTTPLHHAPTMPLTQLEKQWLKALLLDPRVRLFDLHMEGLADVEPLFTPADYCVYDQYADGDPFWDETYITRFRLILDAIRHRYPLHIEAVNRKGNPVRMNLQPERLEYSEKDDKFRLISSGCRYGGTVNLGRMTACTRYVGTLPTTRLSPPVMRTATLYLYDGRNALERVMLHFAHFEKRAERVDDTHYRLHIRYDRNDETELVIRILSFGPFVKVESPEHLVALIRERLKKQREMGLK